MFTPVHCGLYFSPADVQTARDPQQAALFAPALAMLRTPPADRQHPQSPLWGAAQYIFLDDADAGEDALIAVEKAIEAPLSEDMAYLDSVAETLALAQAFEIVRSHPAASFVRRAGWLNRFEMRVNALSTSPYKDSFIENLWMAALVLGAGVVLEREEIFQIGLDVFRDTIDNDIRPQGHIPRAIEGGHGGALYRQIAAASALALMAEAATQAGVDLWAYQNRGVSVATGAIYPAYYYYTTDKWKWDKNVPVEDVQAWFQRFGGYLEFLRRRTGLRDLNPLLQEVRPIFAPLSGGFTTLSHGVVLRRPGFFA